MHAFLISILVVYLLSNFSPPLDFPTGELVTLSFGISDMDVADRLADQNVIKHPLIFVWVARMLDRAGSLKAGRYVFNKPLPLWSVLGRISNGEYGTQVRKVTVPEGFTNKQIGELFGQAWDETDQGYLFPDTYYLDEFATEFEIRDKMKNNFRMKVGDITVGVVIIASILEEEIKHPEDLPIVAGILFKRLELDMPLQVDAVPETYKAKGLPAIPVSNPGPATIKAAFNPTKSKYLYYLTGRDGKTYYARTFEEHKINKAKYLK